MLCSPAHKPSDDNLESDPDFWAAPGCAGSYITLVWIVGAAQCCYPGWGENISCISVYFSQFMPAEWLDEEILLNLCHSPPGVWAHGDYCKINPKTGGIVMLGRRYSVLVGVLWGNKCCNWHSSPRSKMHMVLPPLLALYSFYWISYCGFQPLN